MTNWTELFKRHFKLTKDVDELCKLIFGEPAQRDLIIDVADELGFVPPEEFVNLYLTYNGVGSTSIDSRDEVCWWFRRLEDLSDFMKTNRLWLNDHEEVATRYFPFVDFGNGDSAGYLKTIGNGFENGIFTLECSAYEYDPDQEVDEFLKLTDATIEKFVLSHCK